MNRDDIIDWVAQVDMAFLKRIEPWNMFDKYETFAKLVAQHERERIFSELFEMHLKAQRIHNHYLHAVMHIKAKDKARGEA